MFSNIINKEKLSHLNTYSDLSGPLRLCQIWLGSVTVRISEQWNHSQPGRRWNKSYFCSFSRSNEQSLHTVIFVTNQFVISSPGKGPITGQTNTIKVIHRMILVTEKRLYQSTQAKVQKGIHKLDSRKSPKKLITASPNRYKDNPTINNSIQKQVKPGRQTEHCWREWYRTHYSHT